MMAMRIRFSDKNPDHPHFGSNKQPSERPKARREVHRAGVRGPQQRLAPRRRRRPNLGDPYAEVTDQPIEKETVEHIAADNYRQL